MINVAKENIAYYFPLDQTPSGTGFTLELYSELSLTTITFEDLSGTSEGDYISITLTGELCAQVSNGEYNYTLYDDIDGEKISIGLIRFDLEEGGQTDDEEYIIYQDDFDGDYITTQNEDEAYNSGYQKGYNEGYQKGYEDGSGQNVPESDLV